MGVSFKKLRTDRNWLLVLLLLCAAAIYWPGLSGPYLFDDHWNLASVEKWYEGHIPWHQALLPNEHSLIDSRPLSMASFMLTIWLGGLGTFPVKLGNLIIHLTCGVLVYLISKHLFRQDSRLSSKSNLLAALVTAVWLLHPLQVSTVLYAIQRMSQIAALFSLAVVAVYLVARNQVRQGKTKRGIFSLFVVLPVLVILGTLGKQNAVIAPILCLAIELAFPPKPEIPSARKIVWSFHSIFSIGPILLAALFIALHPGFVLEGYRDWGFTLEQRLLTQPRVVVDYIGSLIIPYSPAMGLYTDDFPISTGLLAPATSLLSILLLAGLSVFAFVVRKRAPCVFAGWFFFLVAHSVESSFLPLEMYYEHRNYLPSFGLLLALAGLIALLPARLRDPDERLKRAFSLLGVLLVLSLSVATFGRTLVWQHHESIIEQGLLQHPHSMRAASDMASLHLDLEDPEGAILAVAPLTESEDPRARIFGRLHIVALDCRRGVDLNREQLALAVSEALPQSTVYEAQMMKLLENASEFGRCKSNSEGILGDAFSDILAAATTQPESSPNKYISRAIIARLYIRSGRWKEAEQQAELAWQGGHHLPTGALLTRIYLRNGKTIDAEAMMELLEVAIDREDKGGQQELQQLRELLAERKLNEGLSSKTRSSQAFL